MKQPLNFSQRLLAFLREKGRAFFPEILAALGPFVSARQAIAVWRSNKAFDRRRRKHLSSPSLAQRVETGRKRLVRNMICALKSRGRVQRFSDGSYGAADKAAAACVRRSRQRG